MANKTNKVPGWVIAVGVILTIIIIFGLWVGGSYNTLVGLDESVNNAWGDLQSDYQRRADLIPNLVATVQQYSDYEGEILTEITRARASVGSASTPAQLEQAGNELNSALSRLLVVMENYPTLQANQNYLDLQVQLEGTENRIKISRNNYNSIVRQYNTRVRRFPTNIIAGMFGFGQREYFESAEGSDQAPDVGELFD